mmetsp:Transcript_128968/g.251155  ORF Transcript_128968/g.251155 Transcript_128968/m.251155 type:complete len:110 (+) Transcript_128968:452-781(+)
MMFNDAMRKHRPTYCTRGDPGINHRWRAEDCSHGKRRIDGPGCKLVAVKQRDGSTRKRSVPSSSHVQDCVERLWLDLVQLAWHTSTCEPSWQSKTVMHKLVLLTIINPV